MSAYNPWQMAEKPITARVRRMDLTHWRQENPLPDASPFWRRVSF